MNVIEILVKSLSKKTINNIGDWTSVLKELKEHAVYCLPYSSIRMGGCLSQEEWSSYQALCYQMIARNQQLLTEQKHMLELFEQNQIPLVILKGSAAAMYYPYPEYRVLGDIDIIVQPEDFEKAMTMLSSNYKCIQTIEENPRHAEYQSKNGVVIELHRFFTFGDRNEKKDLLDQMIYDAINHREWHEMQNYRFPCLPAIENGLVLLNHIYQHLQASGIGYRQIIDFREFVVVEKENIPAFLVAAERVGLLKLAEALIYIYSHYMGVDIDSRNVDETIIKELMKAFQSAGNFGKKENMDEIRRSETVIRMARNPVVMLKTLQSYGRVHWKATEKYVFLRPFAWIYQIGYYVNQVRLNGGLSLVLKGKKRMSDWDRMMKGLGL